MTRLLIILAALSCVPHFASADAYEASVHVEALGGVGQLGDPLASEAYNVGIAGGAARFTWTTRDWMAFEVEGYGAYTGSAVHRDVEIDGRLRDFSRGAVVTGLDAGVSLRLGVRVVPTVSIGVGPQLRMYPSATLKETGTGAAAGESTSDTAIDLAARLGFGLDYRVSRHWIVGARVGGRVAAGIGQGSWRSVEGLVHVSYYWYPRWWVVR